MGIVLNKFKKLNYPKKLLILLVLAGLIFLIPFYFLIKNQNQEIQLVENERDGLAVMKQLNNFLEHIPIHKQLMDNYLTGIRGVQDDLFLLQQQINADFQGFKTEEIRYEDSMQLSARDFEIRDLPNLQAIALEKKWETLLREMKNLNPEKSLEIHNQLIHDIQKLMVHVGETSNLAFDSNIASYYFVETVQEYLPEFQNVVNDLILFTKKMKVKSLTLEEQEQLIQLSNLINYELTRIESAIDSIINIEKNLFQDYRSEEILEDLLENFVGYSNNLLKYLNIKIKTSDTSNKIFYEIKNLESKVISSSFILSDAIINRIEQQLEEKITLLKRKQYLQTLTLIFLFILGNIFTFLLFKQINEPLKSLIEGVKKIVKKQRFEEIPITSDDEISYIITIVNQIQDKWKSIVDKLKKSGIKMTTSTTEIAAAAKQQESSIIQQETTTKEIAITAKEISSTAKDFANTMNQVSKMADDSSHLAASGNQGLNQMQSVMQQMVDASSNIAAKLEVLNEKAGTITNVITSISKVAEQTNLLSLSASIEAEKAGEHGRSFSIIAREVRRLADQTAKASLDIENMVNEMIAAVSAGVMGVDRFSEEIRLGVTQVTSVSDQLTNIIKQVQIQTNSFENVNQGMKAQFIGAEQITQAINELSESAQQTTDSIQQFQKSLMELNNSTKVIQVGISKAMSPSIGG